MLNSFTERMASFIEASPTPYHAVENAISLLRQNGFTELSLENSASCAAGGKYYFSRTGFTHTGGTSLIAIALPSDTDGKPVAPRGMRVCASHTDSPCFRLKPNAVMEGGEYCRLNTERYGGAINSTWLDRPLAVAGRVIVKDGNGARSVNVRLDGTVIIPNVAIHLNTQLNGGYSYTLNTDLVPLFSDANAKSKFSERLANAAGCKEEDILDYDLSVYNPASPTVWGGNGEFISAPRLDDLQCVYASLEGFINAKPQNYAAVLALFDCEEVGSSCISGADSDLLGIAARLISESTQTSVHSLAAGGFLLSADNAHALHPNHPELADPTNRPVINGGIVLKYNSSKRYITDGESGAFVRLLCDRCGVKLQTYANRSDMPGGSTLGNISGTQLPLPGADIGLPQLAMHSSFETAGTKDGEELYALTRAFFSE